MRVFPWILGGGIAAYALIRRRTTGPTSSSPAHDADHGVLPGHWVWPVPLWKDRTPTICDGLAPRARAAFATRAWT